MKSIRKIFKGFLVALDSLEFLAAVIFAIALFFAIPFYSIRSILDKGYVVLSVLLSFIVIVSFGICIRDFRRKKWSVISISITVFWIVCFIITGWILMS